MRWGLDNHTIVFMLIALLLLMQPSFAEGCTANGIACPSPPNCCSGYCNPSGYCAPEPCHSNGATCYSNSECCSNYCNGTCSTAPPSAGYWYNNIYVWVGLAFTLSALFLALAYMAAKLFELSVLDAWVKLELSELMTSLLIAVFCIALIATVDSASAFVAGVNTPTGSSVGNMANTALSTIYGDGREIYAGLGNAYYKIARIAAYSYTVGLNLQYLSTSRSSSPGSGLSSLVMEIGTAMDNVSTVLLSLAAQQAFVMFFINAAQIMLPVGIFLRSFSLTRKIGAGVLAAVIATSVVYPASFAISDAVYGAYRQDLRAGISPISNLPNVGNPPLTGVVCSPWRAFVVESPLGWVIGLAGSAASNIPGVGDFTAMYITQIGSAVFGGETGWSLVICTPLAICPGPCVPYPTCSNVVHWVYVVANASFSLMMWGPLASYVPNFENADELNAYYAPIRDYALPSVAKFAVLSLVFTLIPIIITVVLMRNLAILFGGEPQFYGLSKLV